MCVKFRRARALHCTSYHTLSISMQVFIQSICLYIRSLQVYIYIYLMGQCVSSLDVLVRCIARHITHCLYLHMYIYNLYVIQSASLYVQSLHLHLYIFNGAMRLKSRRARALNCTSYHTLSILMHVYIPSKCLYIQSLHLYINGAMRLKFRRARALHCTSYILPHYMYFHICIYLYTRKYMSQHTQRMCNVHYTFSLTLYICVYIQICIRIYLYLQSIDLYIYV